MSKQRKALVRIIDACEALNRRPRPMCRDCGDHDGTCPNGDRLPCDMQQAIADARAALSQQEAQSLPEGWRAVPLEPTPEMMEEYRRAFVSAERFDGAAVFRAMCLAAQEPKP